MKGPTPTAIRDACRAHFMRGIPMLAQIANDPDAKPADRIAAIRALGDFGLGRADAAHVHISAESVGVIGVIALPSLGSGRDPQQAANEARAPLALPEKTEG